MRFLLLPLGLCLLACSGVFGPEAGDTGSDEPLILQPPEAPVATDGGQPAERTPSRRGTKQPTRQPAAEPTPAPTPGPAPAPAAPKPAPEGLRGVDQKGTRSWTVKKRLVGRWKDNPYSLGNAVQSGEGWSLRQVRAKDAYHLGMRNKDVVLSVNGKKLNTQAQLLAAYVALKNKTSFDVVFERKGKRISHHYEIVD